MDKMQITREGKEIYERELEELIQVKRPEVLEELAAARAQGDLSENADYDAARNKQAEIEGRIKELEYILDNCVVNDPVQTKSGAKVVQFGWYVKILDLSENEESIYKIVNTVEANIMENKISLECPLTNAIIGHEVGEIVTVKINKPYEVKIIDIFEKI